MAPKLTPRDQPNENDLAVVSYAEGRARVALEKSQQAMKFSGYSLMGHVLPVKVGLTWHESRPPSL